MDFCTWEEEDGFWETYCGREFVINEGDPEDNGMKYCCFCGKLIEAFPKEEEKC